MDSRQHKKDENSEDAVDFLDLDLKKEFDSNAYQGRVQSASPGNNFEMPHNNSDFDEDHEERETAQMDSQSQSLMINDEDKFTKASNSNELEDKEARKNYDFESVEVESNVSREEDDGSSTSDFKEMAPALSPDEESDRDNESSDDIAERSVPVDDCVREEKTISEHDDERNDSVPRNQSENLSGEEDQKPVLSESDSEIQVHFAEEGANSGRHKNSKGLKGMKKQRKELREDREIIDLETLTSDNITESDIRALSHDKLVTLLLQAVERLKSYRAKGTKRKRSSKMEQDKSSAREPRFSTWKSKSRILNFSDNEDDTEEIPAKKSRCKKKKKKKSSVLKSSARQVPRLEYPPQSIVLVPMQKLPPGFRIVNASVQQSKTKSQPAPMTATTGKSKTTTQMTSSRQTRHSSGSGKSSLENTWIRILQNLQSKLKQRHERGEAKKTSKVPTGESTNTDAEHGRSSKACPICGKMFFYHSSLKVHLQSHNSALPFQCKRCDKAFPTRDALYRIHMREHRAERTFTCEICGKQLKYRYLKKAHMLTHSSERPVFICDICGQPFYNKMTLKDHMNVHTRATPYTCTICHKSFRYRSALSEHKAEHRSPESFLCNVCGKSFRKKRLCMQHTKRHHMSQDMPCSMCSAMFKDKESLNRHISSIHLPKFLYRCTLCQKTGTRMNNMKTHLKSHRDAGIELDPSIHIMKEPQSLDPDMDVKAARPRLRKPKTISAQTGQPVLSGHSAQPAQIASQQGKLGQLPGQDKPNQLPGQLPASQLGPPTQMGGIVRESKPNPVIPPPVPVIDTSLHHYHPSHHYPAPPQEHPMAYQQAYNSMMFSPSPLSQPDKATTSGNSLMYPPPRAHEHMALDKSMLGYPTNEEQHASSYSLPMNPSVLYFKQF